MNTLVIVTEPLQYNRAPASRAWLIFRELNRNGLEALLIGREGPNDSITGDSIMAVKPLWGKGFIGNLLFTGQISAVVMRVLLSNRVRHTVIQGYNLAPLSLLLRLLGGKVTYDFHGFAYKEQMVEGRRLRARITQPFDWLALKLADHITTIREELRQDLPPGIQKKTILLPNGVDLEEFSGPENKEIRNKYSLPADKKLVGFIGNWEAWVAIEDILESAQYFGDDLKIVMIGAGRGLEEYKADYPSILFTGRVPHRDAVALLQAMDICLCPYSNELIAKNKSYIKVLEYLAAGKPIVSSNAHSRERFLKEGENTLMYAAGHPEDLAEKVKTILNDDKLYACMARNNLKLAKQFSWGEVINRSGLIGMLRGNS